MNLDPEKYVTRGDKGYWVWSKNHEKILKEFPTYKEALFYAECTYGEGCRIIGYGERSIKLTFE